MLGVVPGIIGIVQATEALKWILHLGKPLYGRLLIFDSLEMSFRDLAFSPNPRCPLCGAQPSIQGLLPLPKAGNSPLTSPPASPGH